MPVLCDHLNDPLPSVREALVRLLWHLSLGPEAHPCIRKLLTDPSARVRVHATILWLKLTRDEVTVARLVVDLLHSSEEVAVVDACQLSYELSSQRGMLMPHLWELADSVSDPVRGNAIYALHRLGESKERLLPVCKELEKSNDASLRYVAHKIMTS